MKIKFSEKIRALAEKLPCSLYAVGGYVRNFLIDKSFSSDIDLAAAISIKDLMPYFESNGFYIQTVYKNTGTVKFAEDVQSYEFTSFRTESYRNGGEHSPDSVVFTEDIKVDALRRDFTCNAVYYDIKNDKIVDPLNGIADIKNRTLKTVKDAKEVFLHDGLRLMRLARFSSELDFKPSKEIFIPAFNAAKNIEDISAERILDELKKILVSDKKYSFSNKKGCYIGLKLLNDICVFGIIFPEIKNIADTIFNNKKERDDFYEKIFKITLYVKAENRLFAMLYAVKRILTDFGEKALEFNVVEILKRLKADKKTIKITKTLLGVLDAFTEIQEEIGIRKFILDNFKNIDMLFELEEGFCCSINADKKDLSKVEKWRDVYRKMKEEGVPFSLKQLNITPVTLKELGVKDNEIGKTLKTLQIFCAVNPENNNAERLKEETFKITAKCGRV